SCTDIYNVLARNREIGSALIGPNGDVRFIQKNQYIIEENSREFLEGLFSRFEGELKYFYSFCLNQGKKKRCEKEILLDSKKTMT
ncbi:MAG: hypothetical protein ACLRTM_22485, partial [Clostridium sp.]